MMAPGQEEDRARRRCRAARVVPFGLALAVAACGGEPPEELGGFALGMSQAEVADRARELGGFICRFRGTRPPTTTCEGPATGGTVRVLVVSDTAREITLEMDPGGDDPARAMRRVIRGFGEPAWRERPHGGAGAEAYHTYWLDPDSTRGVATVCAGRGFTPPCTLELAATSPAAVVARLDSLLGIAGRGDTRR